MLFFLVKFNYFFESLERLLDLELPRRLVLREQLVHLVFGRFYLLHLYLLRGLNNNNRKKKTYKISRTVQIDLIESGQNLLEGGPRFRLCLPADLHEARQHRRTPIGNGQTLLHFENGINFTLQNVLFFVVVAFFLHTLT